MINLIETLFGIAIATAAGAMVVFFTRHRPLAKRLGIVALTSGLLAGALELYVRM